MVDPTISVILPTVRPEQFRRSFDSVKPAAGLVPYELIVVSDFEPFAPGTRCSWIQRPRKGPIEAVEAAFSISRGEYVFVLNDEATLEADALELLHDEAVKDPHRIYAPRHVPAYTFSYFGLPFVPFPFVHRDLLATLGGLFDTAYRAFYADPDLGMRAHAVGVPLVTVEAAIINHYNGHDEAKQQNVSQYFAADQETFKERWAHLGAFYDC